MEKEEGPQRKPNIHSVVDIQDLRLKEQQQIKAALNRPRAVKHEYNRETNFLADSRPAASATLTITVISLFPRKAENLSESLLQGEEKNLKDDEGRMKGRSSSQKPKISYLPMGDNSQGEGRNGHQCRK